MKPVILETPFGQIAPFFREDNPLSNWHRTRFGLRGTTFNCVEQYMMFAKAMLFGDIKVAHKILSANHPADQKKLGRNVSGFQQGVWDFAGPALVREALLAKYSQNPMEREFLLRTGSALLVEASSFDKIWGAGLDVQDSRLTSLAPAEWPGKNLLGKLSTMVRDSFIQAGVPAVTEELAPKTLL